MRMAGTARRAFIAAIVVGGVVVLALALWKLKVLIALLFLAFIIAAERMNAKNRSAASSFSFQSASASTTMPPTTSVASAARLAVSVIPTSLPGPSHPVTPVGGGAARSAAPGCP